MIKYSAMTDDDPGFPYFSKLPTELRLIIWRGCLPRRICELDIPQDDCVFRTPNRDSVPCNLRQTSFANTCPPVISRVCRESRQVAFENGGNAELWHEIPEDKRWVAWNDWNETQWWRDRARDSAHLHWDSSYEVDFASSGDPLQFLAWHAAHMSGRCSFMEKTLTFPHAYEYLYDWSELQRGWRTLGSTKELLALRQLPQCLVVVDLFMVHADFASAASTGLFGLLGDALVQVIDAADEKRIDTLFALAEESERIYPVTARQNFRRESLGTVTQRLKDKLRKNYRAEDLVQSMRPAYMFCLCTVRCNRVG